MKDKYGNEIVRVRGQRVQLIKQHYPAESYRDPSHRDNRFNVAEYWTYGYKFDFEGDRRRQYGNFLKLKRKPTEKHKRVLLELAKQNIKELEIGVEVAERLEEGVTPEGIDV